MKLKQEVCVESYSGYTYADHPKSFIWENTEYRISDIIEQWREPGERHFRVLAQGDRQFELCYYEQEDKWELLEIR